MTKWELLSLLAAQGTAHINLPDGRMCIVQSVTRESGSGRTFIVGVLFKHGSVENVFVRTSD